MILSLHHRMTYRMRTFPLVIGLVVLCFLLIFSSEKYPADKIQAGPNTIIEQTFSRRSISQYADSIDKLLSKATRKSSLVYTLNDYSIQISKYMLQGKPVLYVEKRIDAGRGSRLEKRYYLKDDKLTLVTESSLPGNISRPYISTKAYFRNNLPFYAEKKAALSDSSLKAVSFQRTDLSEKDQFSDLAVFEDALNQKGQFNLVFEGIADSPKAKYIILSGNNYNSYRAPIRVDDEDDFVHELSTNAYHYRGEKLDIDYLINDTNEIVYLSGKLAR